MFALVLMVYMHYGHYIEMTRIDSMGPYKSEKECHYAAMFAGGPTDPGESAFYAWRVPVCVPAEEK